MSICSRFGLLLLPLALSVTLTGCGDSKQLEEKIDALERENAGLKATIAEQALQLKAYKSLTAAQSSLSDKTIVSGSETKSDSGSGSNSSSNSGSNSGSNSSSEQPKAAHIFIDLEEVPQADMIKDLDKLGLFDGSSDKFDPNSPVSRAQYIEWLFKAYNLLEPESKKIRLAPQLKPVFKDVPDTHPQYKYIQALANAGYSIGYEDGTFRPDKPLTREELMGIKVAVDVGKALPPWRSQMEAVWKFSDAKQVDERFTGYVHQDFYVSGPKGSNMQRAFGSIGAFKPKQPVLRSEAAATLWQIGQFGDTQNTNCQSALAKLKG